MSKVARAAGLILIVMLLSGCGGGPPSTSDPGTEPPHGGNLVGLPGGKGYVEVVKKSAASPGTPLTGEVCFYFLKEDVSTPMSPAPGGGSLTVGKKKIQLEAAGGALATPNGPPLFARGDVDGTLSVELDGKPVNIPLGVR